MKKLYFIIVALGFLFLVNSSMVRAQEAATDTKAAATAVAKPQNVGNKICPVSGESVNSMDPVTYEYEGKIYNLCCPACIKSFKSDPQKYIKVIEEELKGAPKAATYDMPMTH